jgi:hypothetical protein
MRQFVIWLLVYGVVLVAGRALAGDQDFTLVNQTGVEIHEIYISSAATDDWEEDVLDLDTLPDGSSVTIQFSPGEDATYWDLKVVDGDGGELVWQRLNLKEISTLTLQIKDDEPVAEWE